MRVSFSHSNHARGSALLVAIFATVLIAVSLLTYLQLTIGQTQIAARSETWNACMPVLEAGIEEALMQCVNNSTNMASSGWLLSSGRYRLTNSIGSSYYEVSISTNVPYDIISTGYCPMAGNSGYVSRTVKVTTQSDPLIKGLIAKDSVSMNGNKTLIDSYDSRDPAKSLNGKYDPTKAGDKADVACVNGKANNFNTGNGDIWGHAVVPPGATVSTGPNGSVGSVSWHKNNKGGLEPGWVRTDLNITLPPAVVPFAGGILPKTNSVGGTAYDYVLNGGNFQIDTIKPGSKMAVTADSMIYVVGTWDTTKLLIKTNAHLKIYCGGPSAKFVQIVNENGSGPSLLFYGLPSFTSLSPGNDWTGGVYAPNAPFSLGGNSELAGSIVAKSISIGGNAAFHYDEAFNNTNNVRAWVVVSWTEL